MDSSSNNNSLSFTKKSQITILLLIVFVITLFMGLAYVSQKTSQPKITIPVENTNSTQTDIVTTEPLITSSQKTESTKLIFEASNQFYLNTPNQIKISLVGTQIVASDVVLNFDPSFLKVESILVGKYLDTTLRKDIDNVKGKITFGAVKGVEQGSSETSELFVLNITPLKLGETKLSLDLENSNLALHGDNLLDKTISNDMMINTISK